MLTMTMRVDSTKPMTETSDPQLQLKKRARRRLVGAVAFAGLAAVVLPMVMDEEPKKPVQDVQLKIPGQEQAAPFKPAEPPARSAAATPTAAKPADETSSEKPSASAGGQSLSAPSLPAAAATAAAIAGTAIAGKAVADKMAEKKAATPAAKPADKKTAEKKAGKPSNKPTDKPSSSTATKVHDKPVSKPVDKPAAKKNDKPGDSPADGASGRSEADDAQRANALLSGKPPSPAKSSGGRHVIMVGAFANAENAKQLQARLGSAGVSAYTEVLDSPDGKKTRVRAGPFASRDAAEKALEQMKRIGVSGVVTSRQ